MIRTLWFVFLGVVVVAATVWVAERPGNVVLAWQDWRISTPLPVLLFAVLLFAGVVALLYRMWLALRRSPGTLLQGWKKGRRERGYKALTQGMVAVAAGDADEARRQAGKAEVLLNEPPLTMLLQAQSAQLNGDDEAAKRYFTAMLERPETAFLGVRGLLMQARRDGDRAAALALVDRAYRLRPKTPWVLGTKFELEARAGQWRAALATLDEAAKRDALPPADVRRYRVAALLALSREASEAGRPDEALTFARKAHEADATALPAELRYADLLVAGGHRRRATKVIESAWERAPHPELARLYGALAGDEQPIRHVKRMEALAAFNPGHRESHLALAGAHLDAKLWGAARTHLAAAGGDEPSARVCRAMARLEESDKGDMDAVRRWLVRAGTAEPDPAWVCSGCGAASSAWTPVCARCEGIGTLDWRAPDRARALPEDTAAPAAIPPAPPASDGAGGDQASTREADADAGQDAIIEIPPAARA